MKKLETRLKKNCIKIDLINEVDTKENIVKYYENIPFVKLLHIYNQYNGLKDYKEEEKKDFKRSYSVDFLQLEVILNTINKKQ
tara:strand:+ start:139 stop:387 length:249 start_codon:yes stop_codon:yes gene_type:complete